MKICKHYILKVPQNFQTYPPVQRTWEIHARIMELTEIIEPNTAFCVKGAKVIA